MHHRTRHIEKILEKRARLFPTLGLLGPRQVGKSTFLLKQWLTKKSAVYVTFDKQETITRAKQAPEQFLLAESNHQQQHLIIDEAQKLPAIFDSIKSIIDEKRRMGKFTLSGSTEFSIKSGIRESLAGRMGITRMYPMTLREMNEAAFICPWVTGFEKKQPLLKLDHSIRKSLTRGGMPIFCRIADSDERIMVIHSWLEAICYRDLPQLKGAHYHSELAHELLKLLAANQYRHTSLGKLSSQLGASVEAIKNHLSALEELFLIYKLPSFENPRARPIYRLFDSGILNALLGGQQTISSQHDSLITLVMNEIYAQHEYAGKLKPALYYYATRGGAEVDLIMKTNHKIVAIDCKLSTNIDPYHQRGMKSFIKNHPDAIGYFVAPVEKIYQLDKNLFVIPWHYIG